MFQGKRRELHKKASQDDMKKSYNLISYSIKIFVWINSLLMVCSCYCRCFCLQSSSTRKHRAKLCVTFFSSLFYLLASFHLYGFSDKTQQQQTHTYTLTNFYVLKKHWVVDVRRRRGRSWWKVKKGNEGDSVNKKRRFVKKAHWRKASKKVRFQ